MGEETLVFGDRLPFCGCCLFFAPGQGLVNMLSHRNCSYLGVYLWVLGRLCEWDKSPAEKKRLAVRSLFAVNEPGTQNGLGTRDHLAVKTDSHFVEDLSVEYDYWAKECFSARGHPSV